MVGHPLDLIKVRMQTSGAAGGSVIGMFTSTFAKEGIAGVYRGVAAPLVAVSPMFAVSFWGYDMGQRAVTWYINRDKDPANRRNELTVSEKCWAGK